MSPLSTPVLAGAALVSAPALWSALVEDAMPLDVGLTRFLVALAVSWVLFSVVGAMLDAGPKPVPARQESPDGEGAGGSGGSDASARGKSRS